jgi:hypothetical protein
MGFLTYLQQIPSRVARRKRLRSLPSVTLEQLGLSELEITAAELLPLTLGQYADLLSGVPLPTQQQKQNFVEYVSHAHSWYKHLPLYPPGAPFYFFIDKYAGCDRLVSRDGTALLRERTEGGFHYSDYPTAKYRDLFGHLAYCCGYGTKVIPLSKGPMVFPRDGLAAVPGDDAQLYRLPSEVLEAGVTRLTAVIHTNSAFNPLWLDRWSKDPQEIDWPEESGGQVTLERILSRSKKVLLDARAMEPLRINLPASRGLATVDGILYELLTLERNRQYGEMMKAIDRVCELIAANRTNERNVRLKGEQGFWLINSLNNLF